MTVKTKSQSTSGVGSSKVRCNRDSPHIFGITGLETGRSILRLTCIELVSRPETKDTFFLGAGMGTIIGSGLVFFQLTYFSYNLFNLVSIRKNRPVRSASGTVINASREELIAIFRWVYIKGEDPENPVTVPAECTINKKTSMKPLRHHTEPMKI